MAIDQGELERIVETLDHKVPRDGAWVELQQYGGAPDEGQIVANRPGFLRLGIEFLKAGIAEQPAEGDPHIAQDVVVDLEYLVSQDSTINFDLFEIREHPHDRPAHPATWLDRCMPLGCMLVFAVCCLLVIIGGITVIRWLIS